MKKALNNLMLNNNNNYNNIPTDFFQVCKLKCNVENLFDDINNSVRQFFIKKAVALIQSQAKCVTS